MKGGYSGKFSESSGLMMQLFAGGVGGVVVTEAFSLMKLDLLDIIKIVQSKYF